MVCKVMQIIPFTKHISIRSYNPSTSLDSEYSLNDGLAVWLIVWI